LKALTNIALLIGFALGALTMKAQCIQNVDFSNWTATGAYNSVWTVQAGNTELLSGANLNFPTMFVGPDTLINVKITGTFRVEDFADDDYVGFVFGFQQTSGFAWGPAANSSMTHEYYLFDWKKNTQNYLGWIAQEGFSLNYVNGNFQHNNASVFPSFWVHTNSPTFNVLQTDFSPINGWVTNTYYNFELLYTPTRAVIKIDTDTIFDQPGCYEPGLFGFYNYSQAQARYLNFNYELYVDYQIESQNVCLGDTAEFYFIDTSGCVGANAFSNLVNFYWDFGDGTTSNDTNPTHVYTTADTFSVSLIATDINGCTDTSTKNIFIHTPPQAAFSSTLGCLGDPVNLTDSTYLPMGNVVSWDWDMGDGVGNDTVQNPSYTYAQSGTYAVEMIILTNAGCTDTVQSTVTVQDPPAVNFTFENACSGDAVMLFDSSTPATSPIVSYDWDINNDGSTEHTLDSVAHVFNVYGTYPVELKIYDQDGCRDSIVKNISVHPIPDADFFADGVCFNDVSQFDDSTTIALGGIQDWSWDFGDGTIEQYSSGNGVFPGPSHEFLTPGSQAVKLIVTSDSGCVDSILKSIQVYFLPVANFSADTVCDNELTNLIGTSFNLSGNLSSFNWQFGDGNSSLLANAQHNYPQPGEYKVTYSVASNFGCEDSVQKYIRVYPTPSTAFGWLNNVCEGEELPFTDQSSIVQVTPGGDQIVAWEWVFNTTDTVTTQNPLYPTSSPDNINVRLTTWSNYGCTTFSTNTASIFPLPKADFTFEAACAGDSSSFRNVSKVDNGTIESTLWDFGNGSNSSDQHPFVSYANPGNYAVQLIAISNKGCVDQAEKEITIPETPVVDFSLDPLEGCSPLSVFAENLSTIDNGILTYEWFLNDALVSNENSPRIVIDNDTIIPTFHRIKLRATSELGCDATLQYESRIAVLPRPTASFRMKQQSVNKFDPVVDFVNSSANGVRWYWDFGDGNTSDEFAPSHTYLNSGKYPVYQVAWNTFNCPDTAFSPSWGDYNKTTKDRAWRLIVDPVTTLYIPNSFTPNGDGINDVWSLKGFNEGRPFEIEVFNRWGELMFESNEMNVEWDGIMPNSNKYAPNTTYVYVIRYQTSSGEEKEETGTFSLIR